MSRCQRNVAPPAAPPLELLHGQACSLLDDGPTLDDADDASHGNATDAKHTGIAAEYALGGHGLQLRTAIGAKQRNDNPPHKNRTGENHKRIFEADNVTQAQDGSRGVARQHKLGLVGHYGAPMVSLGGDYLAPPAEGGYDIVVDAAYKRCHYQQLGLASRIASLGVAAD